MRDAIHDPDSAARAMAAALSGSLVTVAELDSDLCYTAIYSPGILIGSRAVLGRSVIESHGPQGALLGDLARRALRSGVQQVLVLRAADDDGLTRNLELRITPIDAGERVSRLALLAVELPAAPAAPAHPADPLGQHFLQQIIDTTPAIVYLFDRRIHSNIFANSEIANILGYTPAQIQAMGERFIPSLMHPDDLSAAREKVTEIQALSDGESSDWEYRIRHADGSWRWLLSRESVFARDAAGVPIQILGVAIDITRRRVAEDELRRGRDLLHMIFEGLNDGLLLLGRDGRLLAANRRVTALLALAADLQPGMAWGDVLGACRDIPIVCVGASLADGQARRERLRLAVGDHQRTLDLQTLPVPDAHGDLEQLLVHICDMTEQLKLEAQMVERERFVATGRLAATVAHEVNTPLQAIESCLHLAGRVDDPAERMRYLRLAREEIKRVGFTMRQLLDLYRPSSAQAPLDVNGLIERVLLLVGSSLGRRSIAVERDLASDLPVLIGRADEMTQVLLNLVFNAMQAMPRGGVLRLESARATNAGGQSCLAIRVHDTGDGIDPAIRSRIFEPFFTTRADGTGLGLAICRQIVEGHGGVLRVESTPGFGSSFIIEIPVG